MRFWSFLLLLFSWSVPVLGDARKFTPSSGLMVRGPRSLVNNAVVCSLMRWVASGLAFSFAKQIDVHWFLWAECDLRNPIKLLPSRLSRSLEGDKSMASIRRRPASPRTKLLILCLDWPFLTIARRKQPFITCLDLDCLDCLLFRFLVRKLGKLLHCCELVLLCGLYYCYNVLILVFQYILNVFGSFSTADN